MNIFYDMEIYKKYWHVNFLKNDEKIVIDNRTDLIEFLVENNEALYIGFNNIKFDSVILRTIIEHGDAFEKANSLIKNHGSGAKLNLNELDLIIENTSNMWLSLKEAEANLGLDIRESDLDFDIDRDLTDEEKKLSYDYCWADVFATKKVFEARKAWFNSKKRLIELIGLPLKDIALSNQKLSAKMLGAEAQKLYDDGDYYSPPENLKLGRFAYILENFSGKIKDNLTFEIEYQGLIYKFGLGGLHAAIPHYKGSNLLSVDGASYYPNLAIIYGYLSRAMRSPKLYEDLVKERVACKKTDPEKAKALKLVINTTFGASGFKYSNLYDLKNARHITITGQLFLMDLVDKIVDGAKIIQVNTDGIIIDVFDKIFVYQALKEWEERVKIKLDADIIKLLKQKDVNNYLLIDNDDKVKVKGGWLKQSGSNWEKYARNHLRILDLALNYHLKTGKPVDDFIRNHNNLLDFQLIIKGTAKFDGLYLIKNNIAEKIQKVNRLFVVKNGGVVRKKKNNSYHKIANVPDSIVVNNSSEVTFDIGELDYDWYINEVNKRIADF